MVTQGANMNYRSRRRASISCTDPATRGGIQNTTRHRIIRRGRVSRNNSEDQIALDVLQGSTSIYNVICTGRDLFLAKNVIYTGRIPEYGDFLFFPKNVIYTGRYIYWSTPVLGQRIILTSPFGTTLALWVLSCRKNREPIEQ